MATASEDRCPICLDAWDNAACTVPCLHRFCFSCIRRWAEIKPECPLCKRRVTSIRHSLRGDEFEEYPVRAPAAALGSAQNGGLAAPRASRLHQAWNADPWVVGGLHRSGWGELFRHHPDLLQLLRPWLRQELGRIFQEERSQALVLEHMILNALPVLGLHEDRLVESLQADLGGRTTVFVQGLIEFTARECGREAQQRLLHDACRAAGGLEDSRGGITHCAVFMRWRERSPVASTGWAAYQERWEGNLMATTSSAGFQRRGEGCLVTSSRSWAASPGVRERSPMASSIPAASPGVRERSPMASSIPAASPGVRERSPMASSIPAASPGVRERSPMASSSPAASPGGTPAPAPAPSSSAAAADAAELLGTSTAALRGGAGCPPSVPTPIPGVQEELHKEPGEAAPGASAPSQGRGCSCRGPRSPLKRKASSSSEDSAAPAKKPPCQ